MDNYKSFLRNGILMKNEILSIKNFGSIKECNIEIKPITVFFGDTNAGKDSVIKLISYLKLIHKYCCFSNFFKDEINENIFHNNLEISDIQHLISENTEIYYNCEGATYQLKNNQFIIDNKNNSSIYNKTIFIDNKRILLPDIILHNYGLNLKIPYTLENIIFDFKRAIKNNNQFYVESTKSTLFEKKNNFYTEYFIKNDFGEILFDKVPVGIKNSAIIELITNDFTQNYDFNVELENEYRRRGFGSGKLSKTFDFDKNLSILLEEPETSLFPSEQKILINRLVKDCLNNNYHTNLIITTNSPYILTSLNNLLFAGEIVKSTPERKDDVNKIVDEKYLITGEKLNVYVFKNGVINLSMYADDNLINGDYLDKVSDEICCEFDKLLEIKYGDRKETTDN